MDFPHGEELCVLPRLDCSPQSRLRVPGLHGAGLGMAGQPPQEHTLSAQGLAAGPAGLWPATSPHPAHCLTRVFMGLFSKLVCMKPSRAFFG